MAEIEYICEECGNAIDDHEGSIFVRGTERERYRQQVREHEPENTGLLTTSDLEALPEPARWHVMHRDCDDQPDDAVYHLDVRRARTHEQLVGWTAHLGEKIWFWQETDWSRFLYDHVKPSVPT